MKTLFPLFVAIIVSIAPVEAVGPLMRLMEARAPFPPLQHLNDVTYADGRFIAVGNNNTVLTSQDGEAWEPLQLENPFGWQSILHTGTEWQAFGDTLKASSSDGVTWSYDEARKHDSLILLDDGTYAGTRSSSPFLSDDGFIWRSVRPAELNSLQALGIATNGTRLVIVGRDGMILSSDDSGETWVPRVEGMIEGFDARREIFLGVRYLDDGFYAFGQSGLLMTSPDGTDWTLIPAPRSNTINDVIRYQGKLFVAMHFSSSVGVTSDMQTWEFPLVRGSGQPRAFAASADQLVIVGDEGRINFSNDGLTWETVGVEERTAFITGAASPEQVVLAGLERSTRSSDGVTWEEIPALAGISSSSAAYGNGIFVLGGSDGAVRTSTDGMTWTLQPLPENVLPAEVSLSKIVFDGEQFVGLGYEGTVVLSADGITWSSGGLPEYDEDRSPRDLSLAGDGLVMAGGGPGAVFLSDDGTSWERVVIMTEREGAEIRDVAFGGGRYLAVDNSTKFYASTDGHSWTLLDTRVTSIVNRIEYAEGRFYILSRENVYSLDTGSLAWRHRLPTGVMPEVLIKRPRQMILAGAQGQILSSPPPETIGYPAWAEMHFDQTTPLQQREPEADADGDGESNFTEYAYGNLPEDATSLGVQKHISVRFSRGAISGVNYHFFRNEPKYQDGVRYLLEYSVDLETWQSVDLAATGFAFHTDEGNQTHDRVAPSSLERVEPRFKEGVGYFRHRVEPEE